MARALRIQYEGAMYHVTARGNDGRKIFLGKRDYDKFKEYLGEAKEKYRFLLNAYVLMTNHYHLVVETPQKNLSRIMHYLNSSYTTYTNIKRNRSGHLFQGRYKAIVVDKDSYLLELSRYLHLNPVRAKMVENRKNTLIAATNHSYPAARRVSSTLAPSLGCSQKVKNRQDDVTRLLLKATWEKSLKIP